MQKNKMRKSGFQISVSLLWKQEIDEIIMNPQPLITTQMTKMNSSIEEG